MASEERENKLTLQRAEMRMIRWMCDVKVTDQFICSKLRQRLGIDRLRWYGYVLKKDEN